MCKFIACLIIFFITSNSHAYSADILAHSVGPSRYSDVLTLNTMSRELVKILICYFGSNEDKNFIKKILNDSRHEASIPVEWEEFIIKEIGNKNMGIVYGLDKIFGSKLYNYLSQKHDDKFIRSNLLFSFILNMENWTCRSASIVLRDDNYLQIEKVVIRAIALLVNRQIKRLQISSPSELISFFIAYNSVILSSPGFSTIQSGIWETGEVPAGALWQVETPSEFYRAWQAGLSADLKAYDALTKNSFYKDARTKALDVGMNAYAKLNKMMGPTVKDLIDELKVVQDRGRTSFKLANLYVLALMVEYNYIDVFLTAAYKEALTTFNNHTDDAEQTKLLGLVANQILLIGTKDELSKNPMLAPLKLVLDGL